MCADISTNSKKKQKKKQHHPSHVIHHMSSVTCPLSPSPTSTATGTDPPPIIKFFFGNQPIYPKLKIILKPKKLSKPRYIFFHSLTMLAIHSLTRIPQNMQSGVPAKGADRQIKINTHIANYNPNRPSSKFSKNVAYSKLWCKIIKKEKKKMALLHNCPELFQTFARVIRASLYTAKGNILDKPIYTKKMF